MMHAQNNLYVKHAGKNLKVKLHAGRGQLGKAHLDKPVPRPTAPCWPRSLQDYTFGKEPLPNQGCPTMHHYRQSIDSITKCNRSNRLNLHIHIHRYMYTCIFIYIDICIHLHVHLVNSLHGPGRGPGLGPSAGPCEDFIECECR